MQEGRKQVGKLSPLFYYLATAAHHAQLLCAQHPHASSGQGAWQAGHRADAVNEALQVKRETSLNLDRKCEQMAAQWHTTGAHDPSVRRLSADNTISACFRSLLLPSSTQGSCVWFAV
jgi:hypothetical protein